MGHKSAVTGYGRRNLPRCEISGIGNRERLTEDRKGLRETVNVDRVDSNFLQQCDEVSGRGGTRDDGGDRPGQLLYLGAIDKSDL